MMKAYEEPEVTSGPVPETALTGFVQLLTNIESQEAYDYLHYPVLILLREAIKKHTDADEESLSKVESEEGYWCLRLLYYFRETTDETEEDDTRMIAAAIQKPIAPDYWLWHKVFEQFEREDPRFQKLVAAVGLGPAKGYAAESYLDFIYDLVDEKVIQENPFDSPEGHDRLKGFLFEVENLGLVQSALNIIQHLDNEVRTDLYEIAFNHPDSRIHLEAARCQLNGNDLSAISRLKKMCRDKLLAFTAKEYLEAFELEKEIPEEAKDANFLAVAEMACWLGHPNEFGVLPDEIELFDSRELYWPPTDDKRRVQLVKYTYDKEEGPVVGIGMVGSITFALFGEATSDLSAEDVYALHCCWELKRNDDPRTPEDRTVENGRAILRERNTGF